MTNSDPEVRPGRGWYEDPLGGAQTRWWDGKSWSDGKGGPWPDPERGEQPRTKTSAEVYDDHARSIGSNGASDTLMFLGVLTFIGSLIAAIAVGSNGYGGDAIASGIAVGVAGLTSGLLLIAASRALVYLKAIAIYLRKATKDIGSAPDL